MARITLAIFLLITLFFFCIFFISPNFHFQAEIQFFLDLYQIFFFFFFKLSETHVQSRPGYTLRPAASNIGMTII